MGGTIPTLSAHMTCESIYVRYSSFFFSSFLSQLRMQQVWLWAWAGLLMSQSQKQCLSFYVFVLFFLISIIASLAIVKFILGEVLVLTFVSK